MATEDPEESLPDTSGRLLLNLEQLGPLAQDEINRLSAAGKTNNNVYLGLLEDLSLDNPPSTEEITEAYPSQVLSPYSRRTTS